MPIIGWIWNFNGTVFLNRDWVKDKEVIDTSLKDFNNTLSGYINMVLISLAFLPVCYVMCVAFALSRRNEVHRRETGIQ